MAPKKIIKKKLILTFDQGKRRAFLTGFQKRKNERRQRAKDEMQRKIKEERKRIRNDLKDSLKGLKRTLQPLRELTDEDRQPNEEEYEDDDVKVKIVELSTNELAKRNNFIGENIESESDDNEMESKNDICEIEKNNIPGMDIGQNVTTAKCSDDDIDPDMEVVNGNELEAQARTVKSKKEFNRLTKTTALKKMQKSKVLKMKESVEKRTLQKKTRLNKKTTEKSLSKGQHKKKKSRPLRFHRGRLLSKKELKRRKAKA